MTSATRGGAILIMAMCIGFALNYLFNVALGWLLSPEEYGIYGISIAIMTVLSVFVVSGLPWAATKYLSESLNEKEKGTIFRSILLGNFSIALVVSALFWVFHPRFLPLEKAYMAPILLILGIILITSFKAPYSSALRGFFRFEEMGTTGILDISLKLVIGVGLVYLGYGVVGALSGFLVGSLISLIVMVYLLRNFRFWESKGGIDFRVFSFAVPMFFGMLGITLVQNLDILGIKFLTGGTVSNELAGYYQAALILARVPFFLAGAVMMAIFPFISKHSKSGSEIYSATSLRFVVVFISPMTLAIALIPEAFITLIFPDVYAAGADALAVVAVGMGFLAVIQVLSQIFQALGKPRLPAVILMVSVALQIILLLILTPRYGIVGAALSTTLACLFGMLWLAQRYSKDYKIRIDAKSATSLVLAFGVAGVFLVSFPHHSRVLTVLDLIFTSMVYLMALALLRLVQGSDVDILLGALPENKSVRRFSCKLGEVVKMLNRVF